MIIIQAVLIIFLYLILGSTLFFLFAERFLFDAYSELLPDEIVYHLTTNLDGMDNTLVWNFNTSFGLAMAFFLVLHLVIFIYFKKSHYRLPSFIAFTLITCITLCGVAVYDIESQSGLVSYLASAANYDPSNDFITNYYVDPNDVEVKFPEKKRNLIFIFLESMESTYTDKEHGGAFDDNLIPQLYALSKEGESFDGGAKEINGAYSLPATNWTVAAMFAQSAGVPLKLVVEGNAFTQASGSFFPGIRTLGNILEDEGYNNNLLIGSDAEFGGRRALYTEHGNYTIHDYPYALETGAIPRDYLVFWGYEDKKLFSFAKDELIDLAKKDEPFCYTMLTVDTHFEDGYVCEDCDDKYNDQYSNVMACSDKKVSDFVSWIKKQDFYENTTIVIAGDHNTMDKDFCDDVPNDYGRKVYFSIINGAPTDSHSSERREYSVLDIFPTTLAAMGVKIRGDKLGLGVNLYSDKETFVEQLGIEDFKKRIEAPSSFFENHGDYEFDEESLKTLAGYCEVVWDEISPGTIRFSIRGINTVNFDEAGDGYLLLQKGDGGTSKLPIKKIRYNENSPAGFYVGCDTEMSVSDLLGTRIKAYVTVREFENYHVDTRLMTEDNRVDLSGY